MKLIFEWDENKALRNIRKHKISFEEARTVFNDPFLMTYPDKLHSDNEERYINIGQSAAGRIPVIIHTERQASIRLISCRKATANERKFYERKKI